MTKHFLAILALADSVVLVDGEAGHLMGWSLLPERRRPTNQLVRLTWTDEDLLACHTFVTEQGVDGVSFDEASKLFTLTDFKGTERKLRLTAKGRPLTLADGPVYVLIQEGGSSTELYAHAHNTLADAKADRVSCARDGSYRTSRIVPVPADLANHPQFYDIVEQLVRASLALSYPQEA